MSATPLPAIVALIISAYILSATFGRSAADGPLAESSPKSDRSTMEESKNGGGGGSLKQKLGQQMKGEFANTSGFRAFRISRRL